MTTPTPSLAIALSGGLDSFLAVHWALAQGRVPQAIWINLGQPYASKEYEAIKSFDMPVRIIECEVLKREYANLPTEENQIIPGRNALLTHISLMYADETWISALDGEMHLYQVDKNQAFFDGATKFFSQVFGTPKFVKTPFADKTKAELVKWALENGITAAHMADTVTCYHPTRKACGRCSACGKRAIAMVLNGIHEKHDTSPWDSFWMKGYIAKIIEAVATGQHGHYSKKRCDETLAALKLAGVPSA